MDRRETIKSLFLGSMAGGLVLSSCGPNLNDTNEAVSENTAPEEGPGYGRTKEEKERDAKLNAEQFFNTHELETIAVLCDLILPANANFGSATDAGVPEFIEFMSKDLPYYQTPLRGGIMWIDSYSNRQFNLEFKACSEDQQKQILDAIAWPEEADPSVEAGVKFFSRMRDLTLTGYYTTKMGFEDLGYKGNTPNVWDGVPDDVLKDHGLSYDEEWLSKCVDQSKRTEIAKWDEDGNLIS